MGYWWDICMNRMNIIFFKRHHPIPSSPHWKESTGETHVAMAERPRGVQNGSCAGPKPNQANGMMSTIINGLVQGKIYKKRWCLSHNTGVSCRFWSKPIWDIIYGVNVHQYGSYFCGNDPETHHQFQLDAQKWWICPQCMAISMGKVMINLKNHDIWGPCLKTNPYLSNV